MFHKIKIVYQRCYTNYAYRLFQKRIFAMQREEIFWEVVKIICFPQASSIRKQFCRNYHNLWTSCNFYRNWHKKTKNYDLTNTFNWKWRICVFFLQFYRDLWFLFTILQVSIESSFHGFSWRVLNFREMLWWWEGFAAAVVNQL